MESLIRLNLNQDTDINVLGDSLAQCNGAILEYNSLTNFKNTFRRFFSILDNYSDKINAIMGMNSGDIYNDTVICLSELEDKFDIPIRHLFIESKFDFPIKSLVEFYESDLQDNSLQLNIVCGEYIDKNFLSGPIEIITFIEYNKLNGVDLSLDMNAINPVWLKEKELFDSIYSYVNSFVYDKYIQVVK